MNHHSASSQPRPARGGIPRTRTWATGLTAAAIASLAAAPAALAVPLPPTGGATGNPVTPPPPSAPAAAHLPLWAVIAIVAATAVLSVATTLITLSLEHKHRARRTPPRPDPRQARKPPPPRQNPQPGRTTSSAATSTRPTAGKGPAGPNEARPAPVSTTQSSIRAAQDGPRPVRAGSGLVYIGPAGQTSVWTQNRDMREGSSRPRAHPAFR
jgi:hypothetical protein